MWPLLQIIFPMSSGVSQGQSNDEQHLESALQTAVNVDRLDRNNDASYVAMLNLRRPRCSVPTGGTGREGEGGRGTQSLGNMRNINRRHSNIFSYSASL